MRLGPAERVVTLSGGVLVGVPAEAAGDAPFSAGAGAAPDTVSLI
jgi:hypothetical protein